ncbi:hypothetical protein NVP2275O_240 [Vibrio phage 2.275.O._10N.286.54.E11]|nr:hypothetical protein NVP2275O_240 [Vibrio phage 2.275.O._10N.286.54.E11]
MTEDLVARLVIMLSDELKPSTITTHREDLNRQLIAVLIFWPEMKCLTISQALGDIRKWVDKVLCHD